MYWKPIPAHLRQSLFPSPTSNNKRTKCTGICNVLSFVLVGCGCGVDWLTGLQLLHCSTAFADSSRAYVLKCLRRVECVFVTHVGWRTWVHLCCVLRLPWEYGSMVGWQTEVPYCLPQTTCTSQDEIKQSEIYHLCRRLRWVSRTAH